MKLFHSLYYNEIKWVFIITEYQGRFARQTKNNLNGEGKEKYHHYETHKGNMSINPIMHVKCSIIIAADKQMCTGVPSSLSVSESVTVVKFVEKR